MDHDERWAAAELLGCRPGATDREVRAAYRRALHRVRPDTGGADGDWVVRVQRARDLLLGAAPPDRRRRDRGAAVLGRVHALRRATWKPEDEPVREVDLQL